MRSRAVEQGNLAGLAEVLRRAAIASLVVAGATPAPAGQRAPDLTPVDGLYSSPSALDPYQIALRDALLGEHSYRKCQMVVLPSFRAEWVVYIVEDEAQRAGRLFYKAMHTPLWKDMMRQIEKDAANPLSFSVGPDAQSAALAKVAKVVDVHAVDLDAATVAVLERAWSDMLARTRYPLQPELGLDGTSYIAAHWSQDVGPRSGETWSPEKGTPTHDLVAISEKLRDLALASRDSQPGLKAEAAAMASALHARLEALTPPLTAERKAAAVEYAKSLPVSALEPSLPSTRLDLWLPRTMDARGLEWFISDCDLKAEHWTRKQAPLCVGARVSGRDPLYLRFHLLVGNDADGVAGKPEVLWQSFASCNPPDVASLDSTEQFERLSALPGIVERLRKACRNGH